MTESHSDAARSLPSLFIVSLPRSLSSFFYKCAARALGLGSPTWTSDGEVLNLDRYVLSNVGQGLSCHYLRAADDGFVAVRDYLAQIVRPQGMAYKDVVQPFIMTDFLRSDQELRVVRIERPVADVAYSMLRRGWTYPGDLLKHSSAPEAVVAGLLEAQAALRKIPSKVVRFDDLAFDARVIEKVLRSLYPEAPLDEISEHHDEFQRQRDEVLARRRSSEYEMLRLLAEYLTAGGVQDID